jgi:hypothetical protein
MSTSVGDDIIAGSRSPTSWAMGKLSVWSVASTSLGDGGVLGVHTATITAALKAAPRAFKS